MYTLNVDPDPIISECNPFGDFVVYKDFTITHPHHSPSSRVLAGIVIQCVEKTTTVTDAAGTVYNTTQAINALTSNQVNYSNGKYLEYFKINTDGKSRVGDQFQNGPIVQYENTKRLYVPYTYDTDDAKYNTYKTAGEIVMVGENWFISNTHPNYNTIKSRAMGWTKADGPANGLEYMVYSQDKYDELKSYASSNILTHRVVVRWTHADPNTVVVSTINRARGSRSPITSTKTANEVKQLKSKPNPRQSSRTTAAAAATARAGVRAGAASRASARRGGRRRYRRSMKKK